MSNSEQLPARISLDPAEPVRPFRVVQQELAFHDAPIPAVGLPMTRLVRIRKRVENCERPVDLWTVVGATAFGAFLSLLVNCYAEIRSQEPIGYVNCWVALVCLVITVSSYFTHRETSGRVRDSVQTVLDELDEIIASSGGR